MVRVRYNPFATERHELFSVLIPDQCVSRLKENMDTAWSPQLLLSREPLREGPVRGRVSRRAFTLRKVLRRSGDVFSWKISSHMCQAVASGRLIPADSGTRIVISLGMSRFGAIFLTLWVIAVACGAAVFALASLVSATALIGLVACLAMLAVVGAGYAYLCQMASGARGGPDEYQFLLEFLLRVLCAEEIPRHGR
jgi:hypothetical protein